MKEFMLIFRHEDGRKVASPEQIQVWMQQTAGWIGDIAARGKFVGGAGLAFDGAMVVHADGSVSDGPAGNIRETLGGYIIIKAASAGEAAGLAKGSPVLQGKGNTVEVRRLQREKDMHC